MLWCYLLHLGYNMWLEEDAPLQKDFGRARAKPYVRAKPYLRCDQRLFRELTAQMSEQALNMVVIDLGEGVKYQSHPELSVRGSWSVKKLRKELDRMRSLGLEPIPKLNFSTAHDEWLGPYARCVSTDKYYRVCRNLISEVVEIFNKPRFFHLGMDEETARHQHRYLYAVMRQHQLWWHDLYFFINELEKLNVRPWVWADYLWHHPNEFFKKMPKSVLQSNWYYGNVFRSTRNYVKAYLALEEKGYDQVPCGSNDLNDENFGLMVNYLTKRIAPERLKGFCIAPWRPTLPEYRRRLKNAVEIIALHSKQTCPAHLR